ncbi:MAG: ABC transporter permease [Eubacteriales bacterium]|nr:ABC transporter permease [Eubacteriales bacterium]
MSRNQRGFGSAVERIENRKGIGAIVRFTRSNAGILVAFVLLFIIMSLGAENFFSTGNFLNVMRNVSTNAFLAMGVMMSLILAGIDLTGGAMLALSGCVCVVGLDRWGMSIPMAITLGILVGVVTGFINGWVIAYSGIHPFIVTLAMQSICRGFAYLIAGGQPVTLYGRTDFSNIGNGFWLGIPLPAIYMIVALILLGLLMNKTKAGRHIYATGGNELAARFSGINIKRTKILVWTLSGGFAAIAGIVLAARMTSGQPAVGLGYETDAIAASVVGGTSMYGGVGSVGGMVIGVFIIGIISNGLNLLHVNSYWQYVAKGLIILFAVYIDMVRKNRETSGGTRLLFRFRKDRRKPTL